MMANEKLKMRIKKYLNQEGENGPKFSKQCFLSQQK